MIYDGHVTQCFHGRGGAVCWGVLGKVFFILPKRRKVVPNPLHFEISTCLLDIMVATLGLQKELAEKKDEDDMYDGKTKKNPLF